MSRPAESVEPPEYLTASDVAAVFQVTRQHVYRMIHRGDLEAVWMGGTPRIHRDALARFVAQGGVRHGRDAKDLPAYKRRRTASGRK